MKCVYETIGKLCNGSKKVVAVYAMKACKGSNCIAQDAS